MKSIKQRVAAFLLAVMMTVSGMPIEAFAAEATNSPPEEVESVLRLDNNENKPLETENTTDEEVIKPEGTSSTTQDKPAIEEDAPEESETLDISEDKTSEDMDKQEASNDNTIEGDPEGTVTSKDGKTRITHFDIKWADTSDKTKVNDLDESQEQAKAQISWAISGERSYAPGTIQITINDTMHIGDKGEYLYKYDKYAMPVKELVLNNGKPDYNVDYGNSDFAYIKNNNGTLTLVNVSTLSPANQGNVTIIYKGNRDNDHSKDPRRNFDSEEMGSLNSKISVKIDDNENVERVSGDIYLKVVKTPKLMVYKKAKKETTWPSYVDESIAPLNRDDYVYFVYGISVYASKYFNFDINIKDVMPEGQELVGYTLINEKERTDLLKYIKNGNLKGKKFKKAEDVKELNITQKNVNGMFYPSYEYFFNQISWVSGYRVYLIAKAPRSKVDDGKRYDWTNTANVTVKTNETKPRTLKESSSDSVFYQKMKFTAPTGYFIIKKYYDREHISKEDKISHGALNKLINDIPVDLKWELYGDAEALPYTYDSSKGNTDDLKAYGHKKYKSVVSDDYLFFDKDLTKPLDNQDIEVSKIEFELEPKKYIDNGGNFLWKADNDKACKTIFYGKKSHDGRWEKIGETSSNTKTTINNIPSGYIRVKAETETNAHGLKAKMVVHHKLKPSARVKKYAKEQNDQKKSIELYNIATLSAYDNKGKLVAIKGTSEGTPAVNKTLELDKKEYGSQMYHDYDSVDLVGINKRISVDKSAYSSVNDVEKKQFIKKWNVYFQQNIRGVKKSDFAGLNKGTFYDLLPKGAIFDKNSLDIGGHTIRVIYADSADSVADILMNNLKVGNLKIIHNFRGTGRDLLVIKYSGKLDENSLKKAKDYEDMVTGLTFEYNTITTWEAYKDYGSELDNYAVLESNVDEDAGGSKDVVPESYKWPDDIKKALTNLNPDHDDPRFLYASAKESIDGNTIAITGLSKNVKSDNDQKYVQDASVKEDGNYSYKLRLASHKETTTSDIILYDSLENYNLLNSDKDHGAKRWRGTLESVDVTQPISKGIDAIVYYSTVKNLDIKENKDLSNTSIWSKEKPKDLSKVTAVAVDLRKDKNGNPFKLKSEESVVAILNMKAPYNTNKDKIDKDALAVNEVYANTTVTTELDNKSEHKLIDTGYTTVKLLPISTNATIKANKKLLGADSKAIGLKGGEFKFELKDNSGKTIQTKTNDKNGNIIFDPMKYNSWNAGEHTYKIVEVKGNSETTAYDSHEELVKVKVEKSGDSELKATITYDKDGANFTNHEVESIKTKIEASKIFYGKGGAKEDPKAGAFEFILRDSSGKEVAKATNDKTGKIVFKELEFKPNQVGEHKYTIEEVKGKDPTIEYDDHKENVVVKVRLTENYKLKADVVYDKDKAVFKNKLKTSSLQIIKLKDKNKPFSLEEVKDNNILDSYKVPEDKLSDTLDGAEFKLYRLDSGKEVLIDTLTTKNGITAKIDGLLAGKYKIVETKAPKGYYVAKGPVEFEITDKDAGKLIAKFINDEGIEDLPSTGGRGTKIFIGTGITLLGLMVGAMYVANKKKKQVTSK